MPYSSMDNAARIDDGLAAASVGAELSGPSRRSLSQLGSVIELDAGSVLTREGEPTESLSLVLAGRVALRMRVPERGTVTILTVEPGDIVGWSALVGPYRATSTAVAVAPTELATFDGAALRAELQRDQRLAAEFYPLVLRAVSRRLVGTRLQLLDLFTQRWTQPW